MSKNIGEYIAKPTVSVPPLDVLASKKLDESCGPSATEIMPVSKNLFLVSSRVKNNDCAYAF